MTFFCFSKSFT